MGKRGPRPTDEIPTKDAALSARITIRTRQRLDAASKRSQRTLSEEIETRLIGSLDQDERAEHHLAMVLVEGVEAVKGFTGKDWVNDPYTFRLMCAVVAELLDAFMPEGEIRMPETHALARGFAGAPSGMRDAVLKEAATAPPESFANMIAGGLQVTLQNRGRAPGVTRAKSEMYRKAADHLVGLITKPVPIAPHSTERQ